MIINHLIHIQITQIIQDSNHLSYKIFNNLKHKI
jgi:hypothetical protein